jgi:hypothetical protein
LKQQAVLAVDLDTIRIGGPKIITDPILWREFHICLYKLFIKILEM